MASKHPDRLAGLRKMAPDATAPKPAAAPAPAPAPSAPARERGEPVNVRMPAELRARLAAESARRTAEAGRTVTVQAVILDVLGKALPHG